MVKKQKAERKPRAKKAEAETTTTAVADNPKMISPNKLKKLLTHARKAHQDGRSIAGELGSAIKTAADNDNLHKKAFASVQSADRMEPEALADYFAHRDFYEEVTGLRKRAGSVMRMDFGTGDRAAEDEDPDPDFEDSKVTQIGTAARKVAEAAGSKLA
jgi:hypothetical protein